MGNFLGVQILAHVLMNLEENIESIDHLKLSIHSCIMGKDEMPDTALEWRYLRKIEQVLPFAIRDNLIIDNLPFVTCLVRKYSRRLPPHVDREDMVGAGIIGLVQAAQKFDKRQQVKFKTYAYLKIRGYILDFLRENTLIHTPRNKDHFNILQANGEEKDFDFPLSNEDGPLNILESEESNNNLRETIDKLRKNEGLIVYYRYYLNMRVKEIAKILNMSEGRISQLHKNALKSLRSNYCQYSALNESRR